MRNGKRLGLTLVLLPLVANIGLAACGGNSSTVEPEIEEELILAAMEATIQDEYRAELIYQGVLDDFGEVRPFVNIINAEVRHSESIARLYATRGIPVPESQWTASQIPRFPSLSTACQAGVEAEIENAEIYDKYFDLPLPDDVKFVFENNRRASINNHLPAFQRCS